MFMNYEYALIMLHKVNLFKKISFWFKFSLVPRFRDNTEKERKNYMYMKLNYDGNLFRMMNITCILLLIVPRHVKARFKTFELTLSCLSGLVSFL